MTESQFRAARGTYESMSARFAVLQNDEERLEFLDRVKGYYVDVREDMSNLLVDIHDDDNSPLILFTGNCVARYKLWISLLRDAGVGGEYFMLNYGPENPDDFGHRTVGRLFDDGYHPIFENERALEIGAPNVYSPMADVLDKLGVENDLIHSGDPAITGIVGDADTRLRSGGAFRSIENDELPCLQRQTDVGSTDSGRELYHDAGLDEEVRQLRTMLENLNLLDKTLLDVVVTDTQGGGIELVESQRVADVLRNLPMEDIRQSNREYLVDNYNFFVSLFKPYGLSPESKLSHDVLLFMNYYLDLLSKDVHLNSELVLLSGFPPHIYWNIYNLLGVEPFKKLDLGVKLDVSLYRILFESGDDIVLDRLLSNYFLPSEFQWEFLNTGDEWLIKGLATRRDLLPEIKNRLLTYTNLEILSCLVHNLSLDFTDSDIERLLSTQYSDILAELYIRAPGLNRPDLRQRIIDIGSDALLVNLSNIFIYREVTDLDFQFWYSIDMIEVRINLSALKNLPIDMYYDLYAMNNTYINANLAMNVATPVDILIRLWGLHDPELNFYLLQHPRFPDEYRSQLIEEVGAYDYSTFQTLTLEHDISQLPREISDVIFYLLPEIYRYKNMKKFAEATVIDYLLSEDVTSDEFDRYDYYYLEIGNHEDFTNEYFARIAEGANPFHMVFVRTQVKNIPSVVSEDFITRAGLDEGHLEIVCQYIMEQGAYIKIGSLIRFAEEYPYDDVRRVILEILIGS